MRQPLCTDTVVMEMVAVETMMLSSSFSSFIHDVLYVNRSAEIDDINAVL